MAKRVHNKRRYGIGVEYKGKHYVIEARRFEEVTDKVADLFKEAYGDAVTFYDVKEKVEKKPNTTTKKKSKGGK